MEKNGERQKEYTNSQVEEVRNKIKEHITKYGSVTAGIYYGEEFISIDGKSYNCISQDYLADHAVSVIGWDDNYAVSNFKSNCQPSKPGAWLIQNSHGSFRPYIYVSYEDVWIEYGMYGLIDMEDINYDKIYQYDYLGEIMRYGGQVNEIYAVNSFKKSEENEYLTEISFYAIEDEEYEIYINKTDGTTDVGKYKKIDSVGKTDSKYVTIKLDVPIQLSGKEFAIMIKYISTEKKAVIPLETKVDGIEDTYYCSSNMGESYISLNGCSFTDMKKTEILQDANACIKAFTTFKEGTGDTGETEKTEITSEQYNVSDQNKIISKILPKTYIADFKNIINCNVNYNILDSEKNIINDENEIISTGMFLFTDSYESYKLIVEGDVNGDGNLTGTDLILATRHFLKFNGEELSEDGIIAGDLNDDNNITGTDLINMKALIVK